MHNQNKYIMHLRKIGVEKVKDLDKNFDSIIDKWTKKAYDLYKYEGELKLIKEKGKIIINIIINN